MINYNKINQLIEHNFSKKSGWLFGRGLTCDEQIGLFDHSLNLEDISQANVIFILGNIDSDVIKKLKLFSTDKLQQSIFFLIGNKACGNSLYRSHTSIGLSLEDSFEGPLKILRINDFKIREGQLERLILDLLKEELH